MASSGSCLVLLLLQGLAALEVELPEAYDYVAPCFPPHFRVFEAIFQMYHIQFAQVTCATAGACCLHSACASIRHRGAATAVIVTGGVPHEPPFLLAAVPINQTVLQPLLLDGCEHGALAHAVLPCPACHMSQANDSGMVVTSIPSCMLRLWTSSGRVQSS